MVVERKLIWGEVVVEMVGSGGSGVFCTERRVGEAFGNSGTGREVKLVLELRMT